MPFSTDPQTEKMASSLHSRMTSPNDYNLIFIHSLKK